MNALQRLVRRTAHLARIVRRIAGMPDYAAYVDHLRHAHPECAIPTEREYYALYLRGRYDGKATRCC